MTPAGRGREDRATLRLSRLGRGDLRLSTGFYTASARWRRGDGSRGSS